VANRLRFLTGIGHENYISYYCLPGALGKGSDSFQSCAHTNRALGDQ
jgi:hypothetical protein